MSIQERVADRIVAAALVLSALIPGPGGEYLRLDTLRRKAAMDSRAQTGTGGLIRLVIGIAVAVIVAVGVAIPIVNDVIASANLTGLTALVVGFIPVMIAVLIFVGTVSPIMNSA